MPVFFTTKPTVSVMRVPTPYGTIVARIILIVFIINVFTFKPAFALQHEGKQKITVQASYISLESVLKQIERQTGLRFMYATGAINTSEKVKVSFREIPLDDVLASLLGARGVVWQYKEGTILLKQQFSGKDSDNIFEHTQPKTDDDDKVTVTGKVLDANGAPIPGATILIKGTKRGTKSNVDGSFKLEDVTPGDLLIITFLGFETREVAIKDGELVLVKMKTAIGVLDEAIVIAYGKVSGRTLTGNVTTIKGDEISLSPVSNPLLALTGRVAGLNIRQISGYSNGAITTLVQGQNSIIKGNDPFYVVDGVPYPSQGLSITADVLGVGGFNTATKGNTLSFINPGDIESVTVLKDADATAIYGSRAANGAILITTKKGKQGKTRVTLDYSQGIGKVGRKLDLMNTQQYLEMRHEALKNDNRAVSPTDYDINGLWDTTRNTDWQKELIGKTAQYLNISGSVSGGSSNVQYIIGGTYNRETAVVPGNYNDQKMSTHFSINGNSDNNKFQVQLSGSYQFDDNKLPRTDLTQKAMITPPNAPALYNPDGTLNFQPTSSGSSSFINPLLDTRTKVNVQTKNLVTNLVLNYSILPGLNVKSSFGYNDLQSNELALSPLTAYRPEQRPFITRSAFYGNYDNVTWIIEPQISYNSQIGPGKLDALVGSSIQRNISNGNQVLGTGYNTDESMSDIHSAANIFSTGVVASTYKYAGVFGRINYILSDKYILNLSARRDGSSRFGPANRYHNFGAIGFGWIFSSEEFIKDHLSFLSYGKLRFSYGTTGNDQIGDYQFLNLYNSYITGVPYRGIVGLTSTGIFDPYLQWELTKKTNIGLDLGTLKDRMILNANYYINRSSNQLMPYSLPTITGTDIIVTNYPATVQNSGWEFTLNGSIIKRNDFSWTTNINLTIPRNKLVKFKNLESSSYATLLIVGRSISISRTFAYAGVNPETGEYQFMNNKGELTSNPDYATDRTVVVDTAPKWYAGLSSNITYHGISLDFLFQFMKRKGANYFTGVAYPGARLINEPAYIVDRWQKPGDVASHQRYNTNGSIYNQFSFANSSDATVSDASYCRLKNISLSWQVPQYWLKYIGISNLKVYTQGQNLLTFTNYKGLDPETLSSNSLPPLKVFVAGLQVMF